MLTYAFAQDPFSVGQQRPHPKPYFRNSSGPFQPWPCEEWEKTLELRDVCSGLTYYTLDHDLSA